MRAGMRTMQRGRRSARWLLPLVLAFVCLLSLSNGAIAGAEGGGSAEGVHREHTRIYMLEGGFNDPTEEIAYVRSGFYPVRDGALAQVVNSTAVMLRCDTLSMPGTATPCNPGNSAPFECERGHVQTSLLCSQCDGGYFRDFGGACLHCPSSYDWLIPTIYGGVVPIAIFLVVIFLSKGALVQDDIDAKLATVDRPLFTNPVTSRVLIIIFWLQLSAIIYNTGVLNLRIHDEDRNEISTSTFAYDGLTHVVGFGLTLSNIAPYAFKCFDDGWNSHEVVVYYVVFPFALAFVLLVIYVAGYIVSRCRRTSTLKLWGSRCLFGFFFIMTVVYLQTTIQMAEQWSCFNHEDAEIGSRLRVSPFLKCSGAQYSGRLVLSIIGFVFVSLLLPLYFAYRLHRLRLAITTPNPYALTSSSSTDMENGLNPKKEVWLNRLVRKTINELKWTPGRVGFLLAPYRPEFYYWELAVGFPKRLLLALVVSQIPMRSAFYPLAILLLLSVHVLLNLFFKPHQHKIDHYLDTVLHLVTIFSFMCGIVISGHEFTTEREAIIWIVWLLNLLALVGALICIPLKSPVLSRSHSDLAKTDSAIPLVASSSATVGPGSVTVMVAGALARTEAEEAREKQMELDKEREREARRLRDQAENDKAEQRRRVQLLEQSLQQRELERLNDQFSAENKVDDPARDEHQLSENSSASDDQENDHDDSLEMAAVDGPGAAENGDKQGAIRWEDDSSPSKSSRIRTDYTRPDSASPSKHSPQRRPRRTRSAELHKRKVRRHMGPNAQTPPHYHPPSHSSSRNQSPREMPSIDGDIEVAGAGGSPTRAHRGVKQSKSVPAWNFSTYHDPVVKKASKKGRPAPITQARPAASEQPSFYNGYKGGEGVH